MKIDVEGWEYPVFLDNGIYEYLTNAVQIVLEFHSLDKRFDDAQKIMSKLNETHKLIHIHANNFAGYFKHEGKHIPETLELTYLLNYYLPDARYSTANYPLEHLDQPCNKLKADLIIDFFK